jgi:arylsulfatase A
MILAALADRAGAFMRRCAEEKQPFLLYLPLTSPHTPLAVNNEWKGKSGLIPYADFVMETDAAIGRVLAALKDSGVADNTLVILTSDNGCAPYIGAAEMEAKGHFPSGPLRGYKSDVWEGGHRIPFMVRWPGVVKAGSVSRQLVQQADIMATLAAVVGAELPANAGEDSFSLLPVWQGVDKPVRECAVNQSSGGLPSIRNGQWKLIFGKGSGGRSQGGDDLPGQLYHLGDDLGETNNLFSAKPEVVEKLTRLMRKIVEDGRSTPGAAQANDQPLKWRISFEAGKKNAPRRAAQKQGSVNQ